MGIGWIDNIYNNTVQNWYLQSIDDRNNGELSGGGYPNFKLDDKQFHQLRPRTHYHADWCGIPWYYNGQHYKVFTIDRTKNAVSFFTSEVGDKNWIMFQDVINGQEILRQAVPKGSDFHCTMRFEDNGVYVDIVNNNAFSGENALYQIYNELKQWVRVVATIMGATLKKSAGG